MKCLTVKNPWAHAIIHWGKDVENRTWRTNYRGPLLIHAGISYDYAGANTLLEMGHDPDAEVMLGGAIIGVVDLVDCVLNLAKTRRDMHPDASPWGEPGTYHWLLSNPRPLLAPVPCRGHLGLWDADLTDAVKAEFAALKGKR